MNESVCNCGSESWTLLSDYMVVGIIVIGIIVLCAVLIVLRETRKGADRNHLNDEVRVH